MDCTDALPPSEKRFCIKCERHRIINRFSGTRHICQSCRKPARCTECHQTQYRYLFPPDATSETGRSAVCNDCLAPRTCKGCGRDFPKHHFPRSRKQHDGRAKMCPECIASQYQVCSVCERDLRKNSFDAVPKDRRGEPPVCRRCVNTRKQQAERAAVQDLVEQYRAEVRHEQEEEQAVRAAEAQKAIGTRVRSLTPGKRTIADDLGITSSDVAEIRERLKRQQDGRCAICGREFSREVRAHLDHCHEQRTVRGVLCSGCNTGLGMFRDNPDALIRAAAYLTQHAKRERTSA